MIVNLAAIVSPTFYGEVVPIRNMNTQTDGQTNGQGDSYIPPKNFVCWDIIKVECWKGLYQV